MSDKNFEISLTAISIIALLWIVLGSILIIPALWGLAVITGLLLWIIGGGLLLHFWGKDYMNRL